MNIAITFFTLFTLPNSIRFGGQDLRKIL